MVGIRGVAAGARRGQLIPATDRARAAVLTAPRRFEVAALDLSAPAPGHVRLTVDGCGVCGSDLPVWQGREWFEYPLAPGAPGHEAWGRIADVGPNCGDGIRVGDSVAVLSDAAYASSLDVFASDVVVLPKQLAGVVFPGEAIGCAFNAAARGEFSAGQSVCVVGIGFIGALIVAAAARAGARVTAVSRRPFALDIARRVGASETVPLRDETVPAAVRSNQGNLFDVVVEAVGNQQALDVATQLARTRGRLVIAGYHQDGRRSVDMQLWNWRGLDVINAHERDSASKLAGISVGADAVLQGWLPLQELCTHEFTLEHLDDALATMEQRPDGFLKAVVRP